MNSKIINSTSAYASYKWLILLAADMLLIWGAYLLFTNNGWYSSFLQPEAQLGLAMVAIFFTCARSISIIANRHNADSNSSAGYVFANVLYRLFTRSLQRNSSIFANDVEKKTFLFTFVKLVFIPLMLQFTIGNINDLVHEIDRVERRGVERNWTMMFNNAIYPIAITVFFTIDTMFFLFGYLFESKVLKNKVRSVDDTWSGWIVALLCYPPFNDLLSTVAPQHYSTYAYYDSFTATFILRVIAIGLLFVYVFATVSLGTKCSNLTNRGIVTKGAYSIVRHPAYIAKLAFWWVLLMPYITESIYYSLAMLVWTIIYYARAITEERHLMQDEDYVRYAEQVRYRFIPYVI